MLKRDLCSKATWSKSRLWTTDLKSLGPLALTSSDRSKELWKRPLSKHTNWRRSLQMKKKAPARERRKAKRLIRMKRGKLPSRESAKLCSSWVPYSLSPSLLSDSPWLAVNQCTKRLWTFTSCSSVSAWPCNKWAWNLSSATCDSLTTTGAKLCTVCLLRRSPCQTVKTSSFSMLTPHCFSSWRSCTLFSQSLTVRKIRNDLRSMS